LRRQTTRFSSALDTKDVGLLQYERRRRLRFR
jgi:hypothetical protein